ncbi:MAG: response regulator [Bdellovibrionales bacterium]|nr:response regulator [Bdellovibrionales bacterium]
MKKRVLVIEDEEDLREVIKDLLEILGVDIDLAVDGLEGIELQKAHSYDLVISDLKMPRCSGLEVLKWMRGQNIQTPVIFQTGHGSAKLMEDSSNTGILAVLEKPWDHEVLMDLTTKALGL